MQRSVKYILIVVLIITGVHPAFTQSLLNQVAERIRVRIETGGIPLNLVVSGQQIYAVNALPAFYENRIYLPAWSNDQGLLPIAQALINTIQKSELEGVNPLDYHLDPLLSLIQELRKARKNNPEQSAKILTDADLLLTDAFLILGSHYLSGRINPETIDPEWIANRRGTDLTGVLNRALDSKKIEESLKDLLPSQPGYAKLRKMLAYYRRLAETGGWPQIPAGAKLQMGDRDVRIEQVKDRLSLTADFQAERGDEPELFDAALEKSVKKFQRRNGLEVDGAIGKATLNALNISAGDRVRQIEVNLERWRWLPQDLGAKHLVVNIANYELDVVENNQTALVIKVVVGKDYRRTPVFSDKISYLVINPFWHVPPSIAMNDILPQLREDPGYVVRKNIKVFTGWGSEEVPIDPYTVDWMKVDKNNFPYRFRQDPGPNNALGRIKFMFPNQFNVYLHDTPSRELFNKTERAFSSGCIRIEKPLELAQYLLRGSKWSEKEILGAIEKGAEQTVKLTPPFPIHILYWTAWVDDEDILQLRNDIYGRDLKLYNAFIMRP